MKNAMRVATLFVLSIFSINAHAQFAAGNWGSGQWGAQQSCPYNYAMGAGASSELDGAREATAASKKIQRSLKANTKKLERLEKELDRARQDVEDVVQSKYSEILFTHIENQFGCEEYNNGGSSPKSRPYLKDEWAQICSSSRGLDGRLACSTHRTTGRGGRGDVGSCVKGLDTYSQKYAEKNRLAKQISRDEQDLERLSEKIETAKDDYLEKLKEGNTTQGGICWNCLMNPNAGSSQGPNWGSVLVNGAVGALAIYSGYQQNKSVQRQNANMGWPSYPYDAMQAGYPFIRDALYGAIGGGTGQGTFGCAGGVGGAGYPNGPLGMSGPFGSTFGNPGGYGPNGYPIGYNGNGIGGGMFNPGAGPWGLNGPQGYGSGPFPVNGMPGSLGYNGYPGGYQNGYGSGPIPVGGGYAAGGFPIGGYQVGGYQVGGYGSGPIPVGGGYGGGYGGPIGGGYGVGIGIPAASIGIGYAGGGYGGGYGAPYGGFPYSNGVFPGSPYGYSGYGAPGYGSAYGPGYGYGYGGYGADRSAVNYGQTSTVIGSLNQEMYNLQMRLRTVQGSTYPYSGYSNAGTIGGYYNGSIGNGITGTGYIGIGNAVGSTGSITPVLGPGGR